MLPGQVQVLPAEVAVGRRLPEDGALQVEILDEAGEIVSELTAFPVPLVERLVARLLEDDRLPFFAPFDFGRFPQRVRKSASSPACPKGG